MLILEIRQAEVALQDGRLDEAFELADREEIRAHRHGQRLVGQLVRALANRSREHLAAGRLPQASADVEKAERLGGNRVEIAELRAAVAEAIEARKREDHQRADAIAAAKEHIENGRLSIGEHLIEEMGSDSARVRALQDDAAGKRAAVEKAVTQARAALDRDDWAEAIDALVETQGIHAADRQWTELTHRVVTLLLQRSGQAVDQGRLDQAAAMIDRLRPLASENPQVQEVERTVQQCRYAATCVEGGRLQEAMEILRRLTAVQPTAGWIANEIDNLQQAAERMQHLRSGPLGLLNATVAPGSAKLTAAEETQVTPVTIGAGLVRPGANPALPKRFMIRVDGVGSFLVLREGRLTVGPAGSSRHPDVGLLADSGLPVAAIERTDEDYFLSADAPVAVNDVPTTRKLLVDGDRIAFSPRCRLKFAMPNAASTSAVLNMSGTRLPQGDARRVVLLDKSIIMGPGSSAHIRVDVLGEAAVLHVRDGRIFCRCGSEVMVDDRPMDRQTGIPMNTQVKIGPLSFVVTEA